LRWEDLVFSFGVSVLLVEVISQFLGGLIQIVGDREFEFALLGAEHDGLAVHATDHVEGRLGFATQGHLQEVVLNAGLDGLAQGRLDLEEAIRRTQALDALVGPLVVVIFDPEFDPLPGVVEAAELGAGQEVLPERGPEAFDLAQGHGVMRAGLDVGHAIFFEFGLEAAGAAPGGVLPPVVGEHLARWLELAGGGAIDLNDGLGGGAAEQVGAHDIAGMIIEEGDEVGITAPEPEGEDVRLPHLIGRGPFKEAGAGQVPGFLARGRRQELSLLQTLAHRAGAGGQTEPAAQQLRDAGAAAGGVLPLERHDLIRDGRRQLVPALPGVGLVEQGVLAAQLVPFDPIEQCVLVHPQLTAQQLHGVASFKVGLHRLQSKLEGIDVRTAAAGFFSRTPHGGFCSFLLR
jgi:hypothetical protein